MVNYCERNGCSRRRFRCLCAHHFTSRSPPLRQNKHAVGSGGKDGAKGYLKIVVCTVVEVNAVSTARAMTSYRKYLRAAYPACMVLMPWTNLQAAGLFAAITPWRA